MCKIVKIVLDFYILFSYIIYTMHFYSKLSYYNCSNPACRYFYKKRRFTADGLCEFHKVVLWTRELDHYHDNSPEVLEVRRKAFEIRLLELQNKWSRMA